jgi:hypothetical protein
MKVFVYALVMWLEYVFLNNRSRNAFFYAIQPKFYLSMTPWEVTMRDEEIPF